MDILKSVKTIVRKYSIIFPLWIGKWSEHSIKFNHFNNLNQKLHFGTVLAL